MPRRLIARCHKVDSIDEFYAAALKRFGEGISLATQGRSTGAIYLFGYVAEMLVKAAYFRLDGHSRGQEISLHNDLRRAVQRGKNEHQVIWPKAHAMHSVRGWAELLILERVSRNQAFSGVFAQAIQHHSLVIEQHWSVVLRYRKNVAYRHEVERVRTATEWFVINSREL